MPSMPAVSYTHLDVYKRQLDDSTSAVDTRTDALIRGAFAKEIPNTTKIIIAQRIASVQEADMIPVSYTHLSRGVRSKSLSVCSSLIFSLPFFAVCTYFG